MNKDDVQEPDTPLQTEAVVSAMQSECRDLEPRIRAIDQIPLHLASWIFPAFWKRLPEKIRWKLYLPEELIAVATSHGEEKILAKCMGPHLPKLFEEDLRKRRYWPPHVGSVAMLEHQIWKRIGDIMPPDRITEEAEKEARRQMMRRYASELRLQYEQARKLLGYDPDMAGREDFCRVGLLTAPPLLREVEAAAAAIGPKPKWMCIPYRHNGPSGFSPIG